MKINGMFGGVPLLIHKTIAGGKIGKPLLLISATCELHLAIQKWGLKVCIYMFILTLRPL